MSLTIKLSADSQVIRQKILLETQKDIAHQASYIVLKLLPRTMQTGLGLSNRLTIVGQSNVQRRIMQLSVHPASLCQNTSDLKVQVMIDKSG